MSSNCPPQEEQRSFYKRFTDSMPSLSSVPKWVWVLLVSVFVLYLLYLANKKGYLAKYLPACHGVSGYEMTSDSPIHSASRFLPRSLMGKRH